MSGIKGFTMKTSNYDVVVIGASLGGVMGAYSAAKMNKTVLLTESTDWIGGQLTSQAVPPDEHRWIETTGASKTYMDYRKKVRDYYRNHEYIIDELKTKDYFCPGGSSVSRLAHPPKLALKLLTEMLQPFIDNKKITLLLNTDLIAVDYDAFEIKNVTLKSQNDVLKVKAKFYLDGTDTGELIKMSSQEYTTGAESKEETGEIHAAKIKDYLDMQPITYVLAADLRENDKDYVIDKPEMYDYFKNYKMPYDKYNILSMYGPDSQTGKAKQFGFFNNEQSENGQNLFGLFTYRRIVASHHFKDKFEPYDITLINWPQNDYFMNNIFDSQNDKQHIYESKQLSLSLLYWLQTEAVRADGKKGYRNLKLNTDVLGTSDGLAKYPYIRESRRIKSHFTVTENMISKKTNDKMPYFKDSVGVGSYHIDLHITTKSHTFFFDEAYPFNISLGSMIPTKIKNLIPACKNIGTTHLTNGCYRLHPVEWNIGEVAGFLASYSIFNNIEPLDVYKNTDKLVDFQKFLVQNGIQIKWDI